MIGTLLAIGGLAYASYKVVEWCNKDEVKPSDYYYDGNIKRATATNERSIITYKNGHHVLLGVKSGKIYRDYTAEKAEAANRELAAAGKKLRYVEHPESLDQGRVCYYLTDTETGQVTSYNIYRKDLKRYNVGPHGLEYVRCYHLKDGEIPYYETTRPVKNIFI